MAFAWGALSMPFFGRLQGQMTSDENMEWRVAESHYQDAVQSIVDALEIEYEISGLTRTIEELWVEAEELYIQIMSDQADEQLDRMREGEI
jgi:hypothetical protein